MKRPWLSFVIFCSITLGILIFSIIFGGYSDLVRTQNRIGAAKEYITDHCQKQLDLVPELLSIARGISATQESDQAYLNPIYLKQVAETVQAAKQILDQINSRERLLEKELIEAFENSQARLNREMKQLRQGLAKNEKIKVSPSFVELEKKLNELETTVFQISGVYNKDARYFNHRKLIFPGVLVVKLFGLEDIHFLEISAGQLGPENLQG